MQPLVSIIIPTRNAAATIEQCLNSIFRQTYQECEVIVIDGKSTDATMDIINRYRQRLAYIISEPDNGVYAAINKGINLSNGSWIFIIGADDVLHDEKVIELFFSNQKNECELLTGDVQHLDVQHPLVPRMHVNHFGPSLIWKNTLHQQGVFYNREIFKNFRFREDLKVLADYDLHLKLWREKIKVQAVPVVVADCSARGLSKNFIRALYREELNIKRSRLPFFLYMLNIPVVWTKFVLKRLF